jgi:hypothetical protein
MLKQDKVLLGVILGLLAPIIGLLIYFYVFFVPKGFGFSTFLEMMIENRRLIPKILSISLLANGIVFFPYTRTRRDQTAKGIFLITMVYAMVIILLKII